VWAKWLKECEAELEFGTVKERRNHFKHHVAEFLGNVRLSSLTQPMVYEFDSTLRNSGRSWAMRRKVLTSLKTCLAFAQGRGYAAQNVARGVRIKKENREGSGPLRAGVDFPTMPELNTLIDKAERRWRPFVITAIFTGMRMSELRGLCWSNVDLDAGTIHVRQRADGWNKIGPPKSDAGARDIPLPPLVINTLRQWKLQCRSNEIVFPTVTGKIMRPSTVDKCWRQLLRKCGMPAYGFHMLRHGAASLFIKHLKWTPKKLQTVMGHSSIQVTYDRYGHLFDDAEQDRADMEKLEAAVRSA
jgi:integrase